MVIEELIGIYTGIRILTSAELHLRTRRAHRPNYASSSVQGEQSSENHQKEGDISSEQLTSLTERVVGVEESVGGVLSKVESVLSKLELNEKYQAKRREALTRLLNPLIQVSFD
jgi:hypothetical protein